MVPKPRETSAGPAWERGSVGVKRFPSPADSACSRPCGARTRTRFHSELGSGSGWLARFPNIPPPPLTLPRGRLQVGKTRPPCGSRQLRKRHPRIPDLLRDPRGGDRGPCLRPRCAPCQGWVCALTARAQDRGAGAAPPGRRDPAVWPTVRI